MIDVVYMNELRRYENALKKYDKENPNKINKYEFQSNVLDKKIPSLLKSVQKNEYEFVKRDLLVNFDLRNWLAEQFGCCQILEAYRMNENYKKRIQRLKSKITEIFYLEKGVVYFLTFTFRDETLNTTDDLTRRRYVQRWLKDNCYNYVANIDFGDENNREHYHALVNADYIDISSWYKKCGAMKYEIVKVNVKSVDKMAKYINKFLNHAIKETTKRQHIIYKREKCSITHKSDL